MKQAASPSELPSKVQALFWEHDAQTLDWERDREFIIRRVLSAGNWETITWLRERLGDAELRAWIEKRQGRGLSPRQLRFWELLLDLPAESVDAWVATARKSVWEGRTNP